MRAAIAQVREWLTEKSLPEAELGAWDLALVEAANNAVKYANAEARKLPVVIEVSVGERDVEGRITDHTAGFDWPSEIKLPDPDAESGRGLYLMKSLTDELYYLREAGRGSRVEGRGPDSASVSPRPSSLDSRPAPPARNVLVLRRAHALSTQNPLHSQLQLRQRLADAETALTEMTSELAMNYESLVAVFRYSSELGAQTDLQEFSRRLLKDLMQIAEADAAVLRLVSTDGKKLETKLVLPAAAELMVGELIVDSPASQLSTPSLSSQNPISSPHSAEARAARTRQDIWFSPEEPLDKNDPLRSAMRVGNGICHAFFVADQLVGTATLGRLAANKPFTAAQVNLLHTFVDFLAIQIVNARLLDERTATRVTRRELEIAAEIQRSLLPAQLPACPPFSLAAVCQSALQVGGDFYDVISANDGAVLLVIADVMGKGVPAALFAAVLRSTIRSMPQLFSRPGDLLAAANQILFPDLSRVNMFVTAKLVFLDPRRGEMISASAGHCALLVCGANADVKTTMEETKMEDGESRIAGAFVPSSRTPAGLPLGIEPRVDYPQTVNVLPPGGAALLYTDGLSETRNVAGELLGEKNLLRFLTEAATQTREAEAGKFFLLERLAEYRGNAPLTDDQTFILIRNQK